MSDKPALSDATRSLKFARDTLGIVTILCLPAAGASMLAVGLSLFGTSIGDVVVSVAAILCLAAICFTGASLLHAADVIIKLLARIAGSASV